MAAPKDIFLFLERRPREKTSRPLDLDYSEFGVADNAITADTRVGRPDEGRFERAVCVDDAEALEASVTSVTPSATHNAQLDSETDGASFLRSFASLMTTGL